MSYPIIIAVGKNSVSIIRQGGDERARIELSPIHTLETLGQWLANPESFPETWWSKDGEPSSARTISFDHDRGKLILHHPVKNEEFDPNDDEALAKMVRKLKRLSMTGTKNPTAPLFHPELPTVTKEDMETKRTVFTNPATPDGLGKSYKPPKPRYNQPTASALRSKELADKALAALLGKLP